MKIGFFGDSFCMEESNFHSWGKGYETYIRKLKKHYEAEIVCLGHGGSSVWDVILNQFPQHQDNLPDVSIFCWTDCHRLFNTKIRNIGLWVLDPVHRKDPVVNAIHWFNRKTYDAAREYYTHIHDEEKAIREMQAAWYHFDTTVLKPLESKTKIIHMWSFGNIQKRNTDRSVDPENVTYDYRWSSGMEIRPSLSCFRHEGPKFHHAANHIGTDESNSKVADVIINAIDNYESGKLVVYDKPCR